MFLLVIAPSHAVLGRGRLQRFQQRTDLLPTSENGDVPRGSRNVSLALVLPPLHLPPPPSGIDAFEVQLVTTRRAGIVIIAPNVPA